MNKYFLKSAEKFVFLYANKWMKIDAGVTSLPSHV